jgi:O-antigen/teichoic acid export membrane protein
LRDLFSFGRDMFLYSLGHQLINASQTIIVTRMIGLEAGAVWSVCTRVFTLLTQLLMRFFDYSCAALAEMLVRKERERLFARFRSMVLVSGSVSVVAALGLAAGNQPFVEWWTRGRLGWPVANDWLLAAWLPILVMVRCHTGLAGLTKKFGFMRYLYFVEGVVFVVAALIAVRWGGITAMLALSILCSLAFSYPYGIWRTADLFGLKWTAVAFQWMAPSIRVAALLVAPAIMAAWATRSLPAVLRLAICASVVGGLGAYLLPRWGLDESLRRELIERIPDRLHGLRRCLGSR